MSSVSLSGGCSATLFSSLQPSRATGSDMAQKLFSKLDADGDGAIGASELKSFANEISEKTGMKIDADSLLTSLDSDGNGSVSSTELSDNARTLFDELREQLMGSRLQSRPLPPDPAQLFALIDTDGDGSISADEFETGMQRGPDSPPPASSKDDVIGRLLASLIERYGSSSKDGTVSSPTLSVVA